ncbi:MAG: efflux RND transporter periplasmic adaptor subunit [Rhodothermales bacterium]
MNALHTARPRRASLTPLLLVALVAFAACGGSEPEVADEAERAPLVLASTDVTRIERGPISAGIAITGTLAPYRVVDVKAQVSGTLGSVRFQEGDRVGQGTTLATIDAEGIRSQAASTRAGVSGAQAAVAAAEAQLALAREQAASAAFLFEEGAMSRLDNEAAKAQVEAAEAQVAAARSQVASAQSQATGASEQAGRTVVRAPIDGAVSERFVEVGEAVNPGQSLFTVVNTSALELAGQVSVDAAARIRVGDPVEFTIDAYPGQRFTGTVARIEPTADASTRQIGVYLRLSNPGTLVGGLFATGVVISNTIEEALLVPESAVREGDGTAYLLVVDGDVIARRPVTVETRDATRGLVAVRGQIAADATVIVSPTTDTVSGVRVRLAGDRAASSAAAPVSTTVLPDSE